MKWAAQRHLGGEHDRHTVPWSALSAEDQARAEHSISGHTPADMFESLMQAAPGVMPVASCADRHAVREALNDAIEALAPRDRWIFEARVHRRLPFRSIAAELGLGKSFTHRKFRSICRRLREDLADNTTIQEYMS